jgi:uncharacterized protein (TIGR04255 family)
LQSEFSKVEERRGISLAVAFGESPEPRSTQSVGDINALFFRTSDDREIAQFRVDGFTLNRLAPYTSWAELMPRALRLFESYLDIARPQAITRVATRYINRLRFPTANLEDYLVDAPRKVPGIGGAPLGYLEATTAAAGDGFTVNFAQSLDLSDSKSPAVLIDVDAFKAEAFAPSIDGVATRLDQLRAIKNRVFFGAITDGAVSLFL